MNIFEPLNFDDDGAFLPQENEGSHSNDVLKILTLKKLSGVPDCRKPRSSQLTIYDMGGHTEYYNTQRVHTCPEQIKKPTLL